MPPEKELAHAATSPEVRTLLATIALVVMGVVGRVLKDDKPFNPREFVGEAILAFIGAVLLHALGVMQGLGFWQQIALGALGGLGGVRLLEQVTRFVKQVNRS
ncbi:MAG: hypothetical protein HUJ30_00915 [Gammaproteobacteria bacterium]|nr:hypothetical protein [Gammaproteobacteria bacterium]